MSDLTGIIVAIMFAALVLFFLFDMLSKERSIRKAQDENIKLIKERDMYKMRYDLLSAEITKCLVDVREIKFQMNADINEMEEALNESQI